MDATLFELPINGRTWVLDAHGIFLTIGALLGAWLAIKLGEDDVPRATTRDLAIELVLAGVVGARVLDLGLWGGLAVAFAWLAFRASPWRASRSPLSVFAWADLFAPGVALAEAVGRVGWIVFRDDAPIIPRDVWDTACHLVLVGLLVALRRRRTRPGAVFAMLLLADAVLRFSLR